MKTTRHNAAFIFCSPPTPSTWFRLPQPLQCLSTAINGSPHSRSPQCPPTSHTPKISLSDSHSASTISFPAHTTRIGPERTIRIPLEVPWRVGERWSSTIFDWESGTCLDRTISNGCPPTNHQTVNTFHASPIRIRCRYKHIDSLDRASRA